MRIYPDTPNERGRAVSRDALTLLALFVLAWLALKVHDAVDELAVLGAGVRDTGDAVQDGFGAAADAVCGVPVVGGASATPCETPVREPVETWRPRAAARSTSTTSRTCWASSSSQYRPRSCSPTTLPARIRQVRELNAAVSLCCSETQHRKSDAG